MSSSSSLKSQRQPPPCNRAAGNTAANSLEGLFEATICSILAAGMTATADATLLPGRIAIMFDLRMLLCPELLHRYLAYKETIFITAPDNDDVSQASTEDGNSPSEPRSCPRAEAAVLQCRLRLQPSADCYVTKIKTKPHDLLCARAPTFRTCADSWLASSLRGQHATAPSVCRIG